MKDLQEQNTMESLQIKMEDWIPELSSHKNGDTASVEALNVDCRLCLKNVPKNLTKTDIQELYQVTSAKIHFPKLHNDVDAKHKETKMIFIQFSSRLLV